MTNSANARAVVKALVITGFGLNCERETAVAFESRGAVAEKAHLNDILRGQYRLDQYHILTFIGGFSFGDHLGAGTVFANRVKRGLKNDLTRFIADGKLVLGICNGFQTMTRLGLVPALDGDYFSPQAALAHNDSGLFRDDWVNLKADPRSPCVFTRGIDTVELPVRHGEGKFVAEDHVLAEIEAKHLAPLRYADADGNPTATFPANPNGSLNNIAGVCDPTGRVFGLMPHPEAYLSPYNHYDWFRQRERGTLPKEGLGAIIFQNAVDFAAKNLL